MRIQLLEVDKIYETPAGGYPALTGIDFTAMAGEFVAVVGRSGSGKSTLLNMIAGIDRPTSGSVFVAGTRVDELSESRLARWRSETVGLVFQFQQLLSTLTVVENVMLPMDFARRTSSRANRQRAMSLLDSMGIAEQADKLPSALSGGQQQRAAIARALANDPPVIAADEPTGNLDSQTAEETLGMFRVLTQSGKTLIMVTHERDVTPWVDRVVTMSDGRLIGSRMVEATSG